MDWKKNCRNEILDFDLFYISYNPDPILASGPETALVTKSPRRYFILDGDYRKEYEKALRNDPTEVSALKVFIELRDNNESEWSDTYE